MMHTGNGRLEVMKDAFTKHYGLLIAGTGALIALGALLFLPFVRVTLDLSSSGVERAQGELGVLHVGLSMPQVAEEYALLWLTVLLALALALLALLPLIRRHSVAVAGGPVVVREGPQRGWAFLLIGGAVLNVLILGLCYLQASREIQLTYLRYPSVETSIETYFQELLGGALTALLGGQALLRHLALMAHASLSMASGVYGAVFGMAVVVAGGLLI
ncbi:MAG: hypothetical protein J2P37_20960, partial [Ktedonobacteraceae bacterium]|nr:hypothetical protein [Ktedonobacteraceae bacterium]